MANWNKITITTCGFFLFIGSEGSDFHATPVESQSTPYVLPDAAGNYEMAHIEREDYPFNQWGTSRGSASDSSSGAMFAGNNRFAESLQNSLETHNFVLLIGAESAATKGGSK